MKLHHPEIGSPPASSSEKSKSENSSLVDAVKELLVLPKPKSKSQKKRGKNALNSKTVCITDPEILEELKAKEAEKADEAEKKRVRIAERVKKKQQKEKEKERARREKEMKKNKTQEVNPSRDEDDAKCPICGLLYKDDESGDSWICCDKCNDWFCFKCSGLDDVNDDFYCELLK